MCQVPNSRLFFYVMNAMMMALANKGKNTIAMAFISDGGGVCYHIGIYSYRYHHTYNT
jgi:hypothetical protein